MTEVEKSLSKLADEINAEHRAFVGTFRKTVEHGIRAGELLSTAKSQCSHGTWLAWVEENFEGAPRTAQEYMRLFNHRDELRANARTPALLSMSGALKEIAAPKPRVEEKVVVPPRSAAPRPAAPRTPEPITPEKPREEDWDDVEEIFRKRAQAVREREEENSHEVVDILRTTVHELVVRFRDRSTGSVIRPVLEQQGWRKCEHCNGFGVTNPEEEVGKQ